MKFCGEGKLKYSAMDPFQCIFTEYDNTIVMEEEKTAKELYGIDNFTDMIGDETVATDPEVLVAFLTEHNHPALSMDPMM